MHRVKQQLVQTWHNTTCLTLLGSPKPTFVRNTKQHFTDITYSWTRNTCNYSFHGLVDEYRTLPIAIEVTAVIRVYWRHLLNSISYFISSKYDLFESSQVMMYYKLRSIQYSNTHRSKNLHKKYNRLIFITGNVRWIWTYLDKHIKRGLIWA